MKLKLLLLSFLLLTSHLSLATIRYVSKAGTSTPPYTTWTTASDSIQKCINICQNGDTVYVANGVYKENLVVNQAIALIGSSMDSTVIDGRGLGDITITVNVLLRIKHFNIYGKGNGTGYAFNNRAIEIYDCRISETGIGIGCVNRSISAQNVYMKNLRTGFSLLSAVNPFIYTISNCIMNLSNENSTGISIGFAENAIAHINNNVIMFTGLINPNYGIYLGLPKKAYISNNFISRFTDNIMVGGFFDTAFIKNNVLEYQSASGATGSIMNSGGNIVATNVIISNNKTGLSTPSQWPWRVKSDYNIFWNNGIDLKGIMYGDSDRVADPMFVKDTITSAQFDFDYHLQAFSPGIDKGDPNILDIDGTRSDIGMFGGPLGQVYTYHDLAPKPPRNLTASVQGKAVTLKWNKNTEADLFRYRVYRDTVPNFIYDTTKIIGVTADTFFVDMLGKKQEPNKYYYKLTAIDSAVNQSAASEEVQVTITGMAETPPIVVEEYKLLQNYPNPFNPNTTIPYRLKSPGYVKVMVYNILGELVRVLVNHHQSAGYYEIDFTPNSKEITKGREAIREFETFYYGDIVSGIYLYRIEVIGEGSIPVFTDMKKMILIR